MYTPLEALRVYNHMHDSFEGANSSKYSSSVAIESNLCGRQWDGYALDSVCLVIKRELHTVMLCDDWRRTGTKNRFTLVHKAEKDIYTIILN